jgi:hypothetical protein
MYIGRCLGVEIVPLRCNRPSSPFSFCLFHININTPPEALALHALHTPHDVLVSPINHQAPTKELANSPTRHPHPTSQGLLRIGLRCLGAHVARERVECTVLSITVLCSYCTLYEEAAAPFGHPSPAMLQHMRDHLVS